MKDFKERLAAIRGLSLQSPSACDHLDIRDVSVGGYLDIAGATFQVLDISRYLDVKWSTYAKRKKDYWVTELHLFNVLTGEKTYVEWEVDDALEVYLTDQEVQLKDISFEGRPISRSDLENIADNESGTISLNGKRFHYCDDDSWAALYYRTTDAEPDQVRFYEFTSDDNRSLTIELWENEDEKPEREAFTSTMVKSLSVLQQGPARTTEVNNAAR